MASDIDTTELVLTPNGYYHRTCVYGVPKGAHFRDGVITRADGSQYHVPTCLHPGPANRGQSQRATGQNGGSVPSTNGWVAYGANFLPTGRTIHHIGARWIVPPHPQSYPSNATNFLFPGAEDFPATKVVQPVLQYGSSGAGGGQYWSATGWHCGPTCVHGTLITVSQGDVLGGTVDAPNCSGGACDWVIDVEDSTTHASSVFTALHSSLGTQTNDNLTFAVAGAFEIWNMGNFCYGLSGGPHQFTQVSFIDNTGAAFTPSSWIAGFDRSVTPQCGYNETSTSGAEVTLIDSLAPALSASIIGPYTINEGSFATWSAAIEAPGWAPYTYRWSGVLSGSGSSITGSPRSSGNLNLQVIDAAADTADYVVSILVCGSTPDPHCPR
jgi:hypothetical protein